MLKSSAALFLISCLGLLPSLRAEEPDDAPSPAAQTATPTAGRLEIAAYFPSWAGTADHVPYEKLDQLYYSFLRPKPDGSLEPIRNPELLKEVVRRGHSAGVKVSIAVGGALDHLTEAFTVVCADPGLRAKFVGNLVAFMDEYDLDGIDIDWEYPVYGVSDQSCGLLIEDLAAILRPRGKLLSMAVPGDAKKPNYPASVFAHIDYLNLMIYDRGKPHHATYDYAVASIDYWTGRGCPAGKIAVGVPFYSRSATDEPTAYRQLRALGASLDEDAFTTADGHLHGYNGRPTLRAKADLARARGVRGLMIWEIAQDTRGADSLFTVLHQAAAASSLEGVAVTPAPAAP